MDLEFIWIKEHRAIKDLNFNFCHDGDYLFNYDGSRINISDNSKSPIDFSEIITGLTAIAGKNGSGKSSFCEAVIQATATLQENSFGMEHVFHGIVVLNKSFYIQEELTLTNKEEIESLGYNVIRYKESPLEEELTNRREDEFLGQLGFIYFSNNYDFKSYVEGNNLTNISTSFRLYNDHFYSSYCLTSENEYYSKEKGDCQSQLNIFHSQEHYRILKFILKFPEFVDFKSDEMLISVFSSYSGNNKFIKYQYPLNEITSYLEELERGVFDDLFQSHPKKYENIKVDPEKFRVLIHKLYKINLISILSTFTDFDVDQIREFVYLNKIPENLSKSRIENLIYAHHRLLKNSLFDPEFRVDDSYNANKEFKDWRFNPLNRFYIHLTEENKTYLDDLINLELELLNSNSSNFKRISNFSLFSFFSTGEFALLSMYARIFEVIQGYSDGVYTKTELLLFLDEPECGFHPSWSQKFLNNLINFLNESFNPFKIQLIITTHSPYILSDLPKENIRLFNRVNNESPQIIQSKTNTFGANIYDLLADSFFMEDGFIGEFAKIQIDQVYKELIDHIKNQKIIGDERRGELKILISIIGEPLIKRQLSKLFDQAFKTDFEVSVIDDQIKKLLEVRQKIKKRNDSN